MFLYSNYSPDRTITLSLTKNQLFPLISLALFLIVLASYTNHLNLFSSPDSQYQKIITTNIRVITSQKIVEYFVHSFHIYIFFDNIVYLLLRMCSLF